MNNTSHKRAAGLFHSQEQAESAVRDLRDSGYDMQKVSIVAKDAEAIDGVETRKGMGSKADDGATAGALTGGALGGITGLLVGLGTLAIPGVGPILLAGAAATTIATTLAGTGIGIATGGLLGALVGLGIPEKKAKIYRDSVRDGSFLVMVNGTEAEITRAEAIMNHHDIDELGVYDATDLGSPSIDRIDEDIKNRADISDVEKIKLYEERLTVNKHRDQTGEVVIGKRVETETATIAVPVERERLVIERTQVNTGKVVTPNTANFGEGQVVNIDLYQETATIDKQAFVREEVSVHKEVEQETVQRNETIRREELALNVEGDVIKH